MWKSLLLFSVVYCGFTSACIKKSFEAFTQGLAPYINDIFLLRTNIPTDDEPRRLCGKIYDLCRIESDCCPENHCMMSTGEETGYRGIVNICFPRKVMTQPNYPDESFKSKLSEESDSYDLFTEEGISTTILPLLTNEEAFTTANDYANFREGSTYSYNESYIANISEPEYVVYNNSQLISNVSTGTNDTRLGNEFDKLLEEEYLEADEARQAIQTTLNTMSNFAEENRGKFRSSDDEKYKEFLEFMKNSKTKIKKNVNIIKHSFPKCLNYLQEAVSNVSAFDSGIQSMLTELEGNRQDIISNMTDDLNEDILDKIKTVREDEISSQRSPPSPSQYIEKYMESDLAELKSKFKLLYDICHAAVEAHFKQNESSTISIFEKDQTATQNSTIENEYLGT